MYQMNRTFYGSRITLSGVVSLEEANQFAADVAEIRAVMPGKRGVILDIRSLVPPVPEVLEVIVRALREDSSHAPHRAAVIINSPVIRGQAIQIGFSVDVINAARYFDATKTENWEELSIEWVVNGVEPDIPIMTSKIQIANQ
jgi:hypothetical protein